MLEINNIDYVEFYVGNASQAAHFYRMAFGFTPIAFSSLETGERDRTSFVLQQNNIALIFTSALSPDSPVAEHVRIHGDSVKDIAFNVDDVPYTFQETVRRGARPVLEPTLFEQEEGRFAKATGKKAAITTSSRDLPCGVTRPLSRIRRWHWTYSETV